MKNKTLENIGKVAVNDISLCDTNIGLFIPIEKMSQNIKEKLEEKEQDFAESFKNYHPQLKLTDYVLLHDISLHININNSEILYSISIILWAEDEKGKEIEAEFYDPFEIDINTEDSRYLKKLVINKLMESFF